MNQPRERDHIQYQEFRDDRCNPVPEYFLKYYQKNKKTKMLVAIRAYTDGVDDRAAIVLIDSELFDKLKNDSMVYWMNDLDDWWTIALPDGKVVYTTIVRGTKTDIIHGRERLYKAYMDQFYKSYEIDVVL